MMILWVSGLMALLVLGVMSLAPKIDINKDKARSTAGQMAVYHGQALRLCSAPSICPDGAITVTPQAGLNANINDMNNKFRSFTNGNYIVTALTVSYSNNVRGATYSGMFNSALAELNSLSFLSGAYNSTTQNVQGHSNIFVIKFPDGHFEYSQGRTGVNIQVIPNNIGGLTLTDGMPVIVTAIK